jgi:pimeloyl-ACP methyl ester carboxylesterase
VANLFTRASAALDRSVVRFMERRMSPRTPRIAKDARQKLVDVANFYGKGTLGNPSPFFPDPDPAAVTLAPLGDGPLGTHVVDITYPSTYEPFLTVARDHVPLVVENQTAHARWWTSDRGRPTIVLLHGWGAGSHWVSARTFMVPYWLRHGFDVVSFVLPYHGPRAGDRSRIAWPSPHPVSTNEGFGQAIYDLRALAMFLRARGASAVGALGMSLGGYTTGLWASVAGPDDAGGIDFAVALIPAVSMARLMWRHGETSRARQVALKHGITEDLLVDAFAVHAPTTRAVRLPKERLAIVAGRGDRITPPDQAEALAAHWGIDVAWFDGGHLAQVGKSDALRDVRRQLGALGFAGREFRAG